MVLRRAVESCIFIVHAYRSYVVCTLQHTEHRDAALREHVIGGVGCILVRTDTDCVLKFARTGGSSLV
jgi:hypothetical protein